jgi:hypothetical protein
VSNHFLPEPARTWTLTRGQWRVILTGALLHAITTGIAENGELVPRLWRIVLDEQPPVASEDALARVAERWVHAEDDARHSAELTPAAIQILAVWSSAFVASSGGGVALTPLDLGPVLDRLREQSERNGGRFPLTYEDAVAAELETAAAGTD